MKYVYVCTTTPDSVERPSDVYGVLFDAEIYDNEAAAFAWLGYTVQRMTEEHRDTGMELTWECTSEWYTDADPHPTHITKWWKHDCGHWLVEIRKYKVMD